MTTQLKFCHDAPFFRYTWPGQPERFICLEHAPKLVSIANGIGLRLDIKPLLPDEMADLQLQGVGCSITEKEDNHATQ